MQGKDPIELDLEHSFIHSLLILWHLPVQDHLCTSPAKQSKLVISTLKTTAHVHLDNLDQITEKCPQMDQRPDSESSRQDCQRKGTGCLMAIPTITQSVVEPQGTASPES